MASCPLHFQHGELDGERAGHGVNGWEPCSWRGCAEPGCPNDRDRGHFCAAHAPVLPARPVIDGPQA